MVEQLKFLGTNAAERDVFVEQLAGFSLVKSGSASPWIFWAFAGLFA